MSITHSSTVAAPDRTGLTGAPPLSLAERGGLTIAVLGSLGLGAYGFITHSPSTDPYLITVWVLAVVVMRLRTTPLPPVLAMGLGLLAVGHLAGGIVTVGHDVLYNASFLTPAFEFDHPVHASGVFLGTLALWWFLLSGVVVRSSRAPLVVVGVLAGLGLGAINETIEFALTMAHHGGHVGGYTNTGWDLVSNVAGGMVAGFVIAARPLWRAGQAPLVASA